MSIVFIFANYEENDFYLVASVRQYGFDCCFHASEEWTALLSPAPPGESTRWRVKQLRVEKISCSRRLGLWVIKVVATTKASRKSVKEAKVKRKNKSWSFSIQIITTTSGFLVASYSLK